MLKYTVLYLILQYIKYCKSDVDFQTKMNKSRAPATKDSRRNKIIALRGARILNFFNNYFGYSAVYTVLYKYGCNSTVATVLSRAWLPIGRAGARTPAYRTGGRPHACLSDGRAPARPSIGRAGARTPVYWTGGRPHARLSDGRAPARRPLGGGPSATAAPRRRRPLES